MEIYVNLVIVFSRKSRHATCREDLKKGTMKRVIRTEDVGRYLNNTHSEYYICLNKKFSTGFLSKWSAGSRTINIIKTSRIQDPLHNGYVIESICYDVKK